MSVDESLGLLYLPTSAPSPDYYGGNRPGDNRYANSVVAVDLDPDRVAALNARTCPIEDAEMETWLAEKPLDLSA